MSALDAERWSGRTLPVLVVIAALALLARVVFLGDRIAHWDEGRVGYDILRYMATGAWEYRPIVHGPFLPQVNRFVFPVLGANDFAARLVVAVVGGLLPLAAWLYRDHLSRVEVIVLALFLAADPILLYYSRFMRNDLLVATFAFAGLGLFVRLYHTGKHRYLYAGTAAWALAFTTKENALIYPVAILGALVLLLDHRLFLARDGDRGAPRWTAVLLGHAARAARGLWRYRLPILVALVEFLAIVVYFYAPRAGVTGGIGIDKVLAQPSMLPDVLEAATVGAAEELGSLWISGNHQDHAYLPFLASYLKDLLGVSGPLALLAVIGFVADRYGGDRPRDLVSLAFYWGFVSVLGYPVAVDIRAAWAVTHAVVPLAIPAAVGVAMIYRWARDAFRDDDTVSVALAAIVLLLLAGQVAAAAASTSYLSPQAESNELVQYAQPEGKMRPALHAVRRAAADNEGLDVLWYGEHFNLANESATYRLPVGGGEWYNRLPLPWYLEAYGATVNSTETPERVEALVDAERPPVIITRADEAGDVRGTLAGYREYRYEGRQFSLTFVFFVDGEYAPDVPADGEPDATPAPG